MTTTQIGLRSLCTKTPRSFLSICFALIAGLFAIGGCDPAVPTVPAESYTDGIPADLHPRTVQFLDQTAAAHAKSGTIRGSGPIAYDPGYVGPQADRRTLELFLPQGPGPHPWVVYIHGGGLTSVSPNRGEPFAAGLTDYGFAVALVGYRLSHPDPSIFNTESIHHPDHVRDVARATRYLIDHADSLGLDPARRAVMGHSAGALLAGILVNNPTFMAEVGLDNADWKAGILIDSEAYKLDNTVRRSRPTIPLITRNVFGAERTYETPVVDAWPVGHNKGALYDVASRSPTISAPVLYPAITSEEGQSLILTRPVDVNASSYYNIAAGDGSAPLLLVHGTAPGREEAAYEMADIAVQQGLNARVLSTPFNHGQINWYFGREDLGAQPKRYTRSLVGWLSRRLELP